MPTKFHDHETTIFFHIIATLCYKPYKWNFTAQKGKGDREKRTSDRARTRDLRSIAEFQPREPRRPAEILRPPSPLCTRLGTAEPATIIAHSTSLEAQVLSVAVWRRTCDRYIRAMGDGGSRPVSVARVAETPR